MMIITTLQEEDLRTGIWTRIYVTDQPGALDDEDAHDEESDEEGNDDDDDDDVVVPPLNGGSSGR